MKSKNILIVGFTRRTSFSVAKVLLELGTTLYISDTTDNTEKRQLADELKKIGNFTLFLGEQSPNLLDETEFDLVLPSPGVPLYIPLIVEAKKRGIEVIGDIELFYRMFPKNKYVAITGTDGKTTTTTLLYQIIKQEQKTVVGGNIGTPIFDYYRDIEPDTIIILELSSFQLEAIKSFHPQYSTVLNIAGDHLDRYDSIDDYMLAKKRIAKNQNANDILVLNKDNSFFDKLRKNINSNIKTFSRKTPEADIYFDGTTIKLHNKPYITRNKIKLDGIHNIENSMAAILLAKNIGISDEAIKKTLGEFKGLPHRLEFVREIDGVKIYNDSKATTVNSIEKALLSFDKPIILIAGGRDKGLDFSLLKNLAQQKVKSLIVIGEAAKMISTALAIKNTIFANSLKNAFEQAMEQSNSGDIVLLSPGCTSFDMFKSYVDRGEQFKDIVNKY